MFNQEKEEIEMKINYFTKISRKKEEEYKDRKEKVDRFFNSENKMIGTCLRHRH